jgi:hypothetical protein
VAAVAAVAVAAGAAGSAADVDVVSTAVAGVADAAGFAGITAIPATAVASGSANDRIARLTKIETAGFLWEARRFLFVPRGKWLDGDAVCEFSRHGHKAADTVNAK